MPPWTAWWCGRETIAAFAKETVETCGENRPLVIKANGQVALAYYRLDEVSGRYFPTALDLLTFEGSLIKEITAFVSPEIFPRFGLPAELT
jgi:RNA polymerase sigma-70 factor, ECF subfamily